MTPNHELLRQLRRVVLDAPDDELFDMGSLSVTKPCGTAHCAFGWALVDPWFREHTTLGDCNRPRCFESPGLFNLDEEDVSALFEPPSEDFPLTGEVAKRLVVENIDRILSGQRAIPYEELLGLAEGGAA